MKVTCLSPLPQNVFVFLSAYNAEIKYTNKTGKNTSQFTSGVQH